MSMKQVVMKKGLLLILSAMLTIATATAQTADEAAEIHHNWQLNLPPLGVNTASMMAAHHELSTTFTPIFRGEWKQIYAHFHDSHQAKKDNVPSIMFLHSLKQGSEKQQTLYKYRRKQDPVIDSQFLGELRDRIVNKRMGGRQTMLMPRKIGM